MSDLKHLARLLRARPSDIGRVEQLLLPKLEHNMAVGYLFLKKMIEDFQWSTLHDYEIYENARELSRRQIEATVTQKGERGIEGRVSDTPHLMLPTLPEHYVRGGVPDAFVAKRIEPLVKATAKNPLVINCECIEVGPLAALISMRKTYGLGLRITFQDASGRQQVLRLVHDDEADFVITANAPFFLGGEGLALKYRFRAPIHVELQNVLMCGHPQPDKGVPRILMYANSSAEEHWLMLQLNTRSWSPSTGSVPLFEKHERELIEYLLKATPIPIRLLPQLVHEATHLEVGGFVVSWEPLTSGLKERNDKLRQIGNPYYHWISLFYHNRWDDGEANKIRELFLWLFITEWQLCRVDRLWAAQCVLEDERILNAFETGAGYIEEDETQLPSTEVQKTAQRLPGKRSARREAIQKLKEELSNYLRAARAAVQSDIDAGREPTLPPRVKQKLLAEQLEMSTSQVSRALNDPLATDLQILWKALNDLEGVLRLCQY